MLILRLGDIPFNQNSNTGEICCGDLSNNECMMTESCSDTAWVYALGWALCLLALVVFVIAAIVELAYQIDYGIWNVRMALLLLLLLLSI